MTKGIIERITEWFANIRAEVGKQKLEADIDRRQEAHNAIDHLEKKGKGKHARRAIEYLERKGML